MDTVLFFGLPISISLGSQTIWNTRYNLTSTQQHQVERWAGIAELIAYQEDVPPVTPLVLWYKEASLKAENPENCEGIMGLYTAVRSGELACFPPGPIGPLEVAQQLQLGARTFKEYCPEVHYHTTDPKTLKRCYLYYNAGPRSRMNPNNSGYVMNGYDTAHQNMILTDSTGRRYRLQALGAWPVHLTIQTQLAQQKKAQLPSALLAPILLGQETLDKVWVSYEGLKRQDDISIYSANDTGICRQPVVRDCFIEPHNEGESALRPSFNPLLIAPSHVSDLVCGLLPGVDLTPPSPSIVLAPISGELMRYTDEFGHLAIQIENEEWSVWITGLRSYTKPKGTVNAGEAIGAVGGEGSHHPAIHYSVFDKAKSGFVDPVSLVPADNCPSAG